MTTSKSTPPATTSVTVFDRSNRITADTERRRVDSHEGMRSHAPSAAIPSSSTTLSEAPKSDSYHSQLEELSSKLHSMESRLQTDFSLSESSKYALKKDIAKVRANIMRLKRNGSA